MTLKNNRALLLCYFKLCASFRTNWWIQTWVTVRERPIWVKIKDFFEPCNLQTWQKTLKNNRAPFLCYFNLCASFRTHWWIQTVTELQSGNAQFGSKSMIFLAVIDGWPWKKIGHLFYDTLSFVHHFKAIGKFKLKLQSGNAQFRSKSTIFLSHVTLKFDRWPSKTIGHLFYDTSSFVHHFVVIGEFKQLQSRNARSGSNSTIFRAVWPWNLTDDLEKQ